MSTAQCAGAAGGSARKNKKKNKGQASPAKSPSGGGAAGAGGRKRKVGPELAEKAKYGKAPFVQSWEAFDREARRLFQRNPSKTRLFTKYRAADKFMEVKVTDDVVCLKFLITEQVDIYELEKLTLWFLQGSTAATAAAGTTK